MNYRSNLLLRDRNDKTENYVYIIPLYSPPEQAGYEIAVIPRIATNFCYAARS